MSHLEVAAFYAPTGVVIRLDGRLDGASAPDLDGHLNQHIHDPARPVILDLERVTYISSTGLRALLILAKRMDQGGGAITVAHLQPKVDEVLEVSGFKSLFATTASLAAALAGHGMPADLCGAPDDGQGSAARPSAPGGTRA